MPGSKKNTPYLPYERDYDDSKNNDDIPNNPKDPIVCNNIANAEFDYTSRELYDFDIYDDDYEFDRFKNTNYKFPK